MNIPIEEKKKLRFLFLENIYNQKTSDCLQMFETEKTAKVLGIDLDLAGMIVEYLDNEGLLKSHGQGDQISITHDGIVEVEQALSEPEKPTQHFPAINYTINVETMTNSQIMQGSPAGSQNLTLTEEQSETLNEFVKLFNENLEDIPFESAEDKKEAIAEVATISAQLASSKPKAEYLKQATSTLIHIISKIPEEMVKHAFIGELLHLLSTVNFNHYIDKVDKLLK
jgi:hypothetical protein